MEMHFLRKMNASIPILGTIVSLFLIVSASIAQPVYLEPINPFETCHEQYKNYQYVFIGRVLSLDRDSGEISVSLEHQIKGEVDLPIFIYIAWAELRNIPQIGHTYIFLANKRKLDSKGEVLFSRYWSYDLQDIPKKDLDRIVRELKEISQGIKQPQIVGKLIRQNYPFHQYRRSRSLKIMRLGYDPDYAEPIKNTEVMLISEEGRTFSTTSAADGSFAFNHLPVGTYRVVPKVEGDHQIILDDWKAAPDPNVSVYDGVCSSIARIRVIPLGGIAGRIKSLKRWEKLPTVSLIPTDPVTNSIILIQYEHLIKDVKLDDSGLVLSFSVSDVPVGKYVVRLNFGYPLPYQYFPNVRDQRFPEETLLIEQGKTLEFVYP